MIVTAWFSVKITAGDGVGWGGVATEVAERRRRRPSAGRVASGPASGDLE